MLGCGSLVYPVAPCLPGSPTQGAENTLSAIPDSSLRLLPATPGACPVPSVKTCLAFDVATNDSAPHSTFNGVFPQMCTNVK